MAFQDRLSVQLELEKVSGYSGERIIYQPPNGIQLVYPCIVYTVKDGEIWHADDNPYAFFFFYDVTHMYKDPDAGLLITKKLMNIQGARYDRSFRVDNIYHENIVIW